MKLLDGMRWIFDITIEDVFRSSFAIEDLDTAEYEGDLSTMISTFLDINNVSMSPEVSILNILTSLKTEVIVNVIMENKIINDYEDEIFFISAFPTLFPYDIEKYIDFRHDMQLSLIQ